MYKGIKLVEVGQSSFRYKGYLRNIACKFKMGVVPIISLIKQSVYCLHRGKI